MQLSSFRLFWAFLPLISIVSGQLDGLQTIFDDAAYTKLRPCAQGCFFIDLGEPATSLRDLLGSKMGCHIVRTTVTTEFQLAENNCFCRADLQRSAHGEIYKCIVSRCDQNQNDVSAASAMYEGYCANNGYDVTNSVVTTATANVPVPTDATPGARTTGGQPTGLPGGSAASSVRMTSNAFLFILILMIVASVT